MPERRLRLTVNSQGDIKLPIGETLTVEATIEAENVEAGEARITVDGQHLAVFSPDPIPLPAGAYSRHLTWGVGALESTRASRLSAAQVTVTARAGALFKIAQFNVVVV